MTVAIAANENHIRAIVDPHFGRCNWYCIYDTESKKHSFVENPVRHNHEKAGCDAAEMLVAKNINIAVAGRFGSKVVDVFKEKKIQMVIPVEPTTLDAFIKNISKAK